MDIKDLVIYRNLEHQELFRDIAHLMGYAQGGQEPDGASCGGRLTEMAVKYGFEGNLWHCFLAFCLANNENAYTTTCEKMCIRDSMAYVVNTPDSCLIGHLIDTQLQLK